MLNRLAIENFAAFRKAEFDFVPGINVLVGGNGTGKYLLNTQGTRRLDEEGLHRTIGHGKLDATIKQA